MKFLISLFTYLISTNSLAQSIILSKKIQIDTHKDEYSLVVSYVNDSILIDDLDENFYFDNNSNLIINSLDDKSIKKLIHDLRILTNSRIDIKIVEPEKMNIGSQDDMT